MKSNNSAAPLLKVFAALALVGSAQTGFAQAFNDPVLVRLTLVSGGGQHVSVGAPLPHQFVMRATNAAGEPVVGISVGFEVDTCMGFLPDSCPPASLYGRFADGSIDATAITDASGIAKSTGFFAGLTAGTYHTFGWIPDQLVGGAYFRFDPDTDNPFFDITQVNGGGAAVAAPTLGTTAKLFASLLLASAAAFGLHRKGHFAR